MLLLAGAVCLLGGQGASQWWHLVARAYKPACTAALVGWHARCSCGLQGSKAAPWAAEQQPG